MLSKFLLFVTLSGAAWGAACSGLAINPVTGILDCVGASGGGSGTVTSVGFTGGLISVATATTTPAFTVAGTSGGIPYFASSSTWASSGTMGAGQFVLGGGAGATPTSANLSGDVTTSGSAATTVAKVNGIAYSATAAAHSVEVITTANATATAKAIPDCTDTGGNHINFTQSTDAFSCGTSSSGGSSAGASLFSTTNSTTVTATSATTLIGTVSGSTTIPVNTFTAGQVLHINAQGYYSTPATPASLTIALLIGGSARITTGAVVQIASVTNGVWNMSCDVTTRTAGAMGTQIANCIFVGTGSTLTPGEAPMFTSSTWTMDTTATEAIDVQATWSTATGSPTITSTNISAWIPGAPVTSVFGLTGAVANLSGDCTTSGSSVITCQKVNSIAHSATQAAHTVEVVTTANTTATAKVMPDCTDTAGNHINFTQSTDAFSCGTSGASSAPTGFQTFGYSGTSNGASANATTCTGIMFNGASVGHLGVILGTADGTNNSDVGIYDASGTLVAHIGAQALGTSGASIAFVGGTKTIPNGPGYYCWTSAASTITFHTNTVGTTFFSIGTVSGATTSGGALLSSITPPANNINDQANIPVIVLLP